MQARRPQTSPEGRTAYGMREVRKEMDLKQEALRKHYEWKGKLEVCSRTPVTNREQLSLAYTPGVAEPCLAIRDNPALSFEPVSYTHLDVYKRQGHRMVTGDGNDVISRRLHLFL